MEEERVDRENGIRYLCEFWSSEILSRFTRYLSSMEAPLAYNGVIQGAHLPGLLIGVVFDGPVVLCIL